jgi:glutamate racemase
MKKKRPILFIDTGIGGIPYCTHFIKKNPREEVCYFADRVNFPYGPREKEELINILTTLTKRLLQKLDPKIIVLACNTATISALASLREKFPQVPFVGTVPAVKPAAGASNNGKVGVLGTARTIKEIHNLNLVGENCEIFGIAAPELVDFIEYHFDDSSEEQKIEVVRKYIELFRAAKVDSFVLGCTHFLFLLEEFHCEAANIEVFDSLAGITKRIEFLLDENDGALRTKDDSAPEHCILLPGKEAPDSFWENRARKLGFNLLIDV